MFNKTDIAFAQQTRDEVAKHPVNHSTAKQLWTFNKRRRFQRIKTQCPHAFYHHSTTLTTSSNPKFTFDKGQRKALISFTQSPLPGTYEVSSTIHKKGQTFGLSRQKCLANTYLNKQLTKIPGPNNYLTNQEDKSKQRGFSMRPKTAQHRNYFIDDQQHKATPGPAQYQSKIQKQAGRGTLTKFKSTILGYTGIMKKSSRFAPNLNKNPGPHQYEPYNRKQKARSAAGGALNLTIRDSFIDDLRNSKYGPGPGDYKLPSQFGHYRSVKSSKVRRLITS